MVEFIMRPAEDNGVHMLYVTPNREMTDDEYDSYKQYFEVMGGHWRESMKGFVFYLDQMERTKKARENELKQYFPTPEPIAQMVVEMSGLCREAELEKLRILEPSAGTGALLKELPTRLLFAVTAIEPDDRHWLLLRGLAPDVRTITFEEYYEIAMQKHDTYTHVIMNPPFSDGRDIKHVRMAYDLLDEGGRLVAIISENSLYWDNEASRDFKKWLQKKGAGVRCLPHGAFRESGTSIDTVLICIDK